MCTDLQGCLRDFRSMVAHFERLVGRYGDETHLLFTGDLVHGPHIDESDWPDFLGEFYRDESGSLIDAFAALRKRFNGRVHALLGNHEHGHIGGPHTAKFAADEVALLEWHLGPARSRQLRQLLSEFPLAAVAPCGAVFTHGAPAAAIESRGEVEAVNVTDFAGRSPVDILDIPVLGPILWARSASVAAARRFLRAMGGTISIYGHDVIPSGFERVGDEQIVVSTSFGVFDTNKVYLELDLSRRYHTVHELRIGREILPLYPERSAYVRKLEPLPHP